MKRYSIGSAYIFDEDMIVESLHGRYVLYKDYKEMADYAERLVEHGNLPCLPKDLENLREANASFAQENFELTEFKRRVSRPLTELEIKDIYNKALLDEDSHLFMWEKIIKMTHELLLNKVVK